ncbi:glutathione S-transferase family protein [Allopusillimonas ginsengisoli]|uniref:glutathione S-transferase family protein n=1 Tax=Allopusillimonas ginsengisoli TaxID=453575 RepID=UPI0010215483|nr:glutathione S-transferase family protein [Allopusillimonas ginsengisoli]TEA78828.1 glutathione S-transferase family protein [Allopusillimonas ginsengisoli]
MNNTPHNSGQPLELIDTILSGNGWKVRLLAGYCDIPLQRRSLSILDGDLEAESFAAISPLRQVPVLKTREGAWLAESSAILWYLGEGTSFLPNEASERARVLQWLMFEQTKLMWNLAQPRLRITLRQTMDRNDPRAQRWRERGYQALDVLETQLSQHAFVAQAQPTIADVALYPYIRMADQGGYELTRFAHISKWLARMRALPGHVPLLENDPASA